MAEVMTATATMEQGMAFAGWAGSGYGVPLDAAESGGGHDLGFRPMELLLVGLAGCTGMDVISILRKMRQDVTAYEVRVRGTRAEQHPMVFVEIAVEHIVTGRGVDPAAVRRAVELSRTRYCGAGAMLGKVAHLTHSVTVLEEEALPAPSRYPLGTAGTANQA